MTETWDKRTSMAFEMTWWGANTRDTGLLFPWFIFFRGPYLPLGLGSYFHQEIQSVGNSFYFKLSVWFCLGHCQSKICRHLFRGCLAPLQVRWNSHSLSKLRPETTLVRLLSHYSTSFTFILEMFSSASRYSNHWNAIFLYVL